MTARSTRVTLNVNSTAVVVLTRLGATQLNKYNAGLPSSLPVQAGARVEFPLWELMRIFGPKCRMGQDALFVDNKMEVRPW